VIGRAAGLALGILADRALGDPQKHHPVAWFGRWASWLERRTWRDNRLAGTLHVGLALAPVAAVGTAAELAGRHNRAARLLGTAAACWVVTGGTSLDREAVAMAEHLEAGDLPAARTRLPHLCGRLPDSLGPDELARAALESVAENSADAVVAPLFWGAICGVPGLLVHRGINTLDAMVGHHNQRYENFGMVAARLDDAACWLPARLTGALACALAGDRRAAAWRTMRRDAHHHPSPNGGWCEAAFAGAVGVQLGGRNVYPGGRVEFRGLLGSGPAPDSRALRKGARLAARVQWTSTGLAVAGLLARDLMASGLAGKGLPGQPPRKSTARFPGTLLRGLGHAQPGKSAKSRGRFPGRTSAKGGR